MSDMDHANGEVSLMRATANFVHRDRRCTLVKRVLSEPNSILKGC